MSKKRKVTKKARPLKARKAAATLFPSTGFWLMKSEPESYAIDDFERDGRTLWTGVRNYQARNFMMASMKPGDRILFYHSNADPAGVFGIGEIVKTNQPDLTALDPESIYYDPKARTDHPIWFCAEVTFKSRLNRPVTLAEIRGTKRLAKMALLRPGQRLSIQPVEKSDFELLLNMGDR